MITYYGLDITSSTASGEQPEIGVTIAADASIPFGTVLKINGKEYTVQDRGGAINGKVIDILCESESLAELLGTNEYEVYIKEE